MCSQEGKGLTVEVTSSLAVDDHSFFFFTRSFTVKSVVIHGGSNETDYIVVMPRG